jgi:hypothetical protein
MKNLSTGSDIRKVQTHARDDIKSPAFLINKENKEN